jgi:transcriptional regulator with GAF, ATPase, and Fis domain
VNRYLREVVSESANFEDIVGSSPPMEAIFELIRKVAPTRSTVLITGESGTGKELIARAIHRLSPRKDELFVPLNCSAIPSELLESELFGHVRGAFSGAHGNREGRFQTADGGTLFLDEIGDMEGVVQPVGSDRQIPVDVRIVSSTNRDLVAAIEAGSFREDLYYRLNVFRIEVPPLSERREDVPAIAAAMLAHFGAELGKRELRLTAAGAGTLQDCHWRGNVRELRNVMERAAVLADGAEIDVDFLRTLVPPGNEGADDRGDADEAGEESLLLEHAVSSAERRTILRALAAANDNKAEAAALLGIGERTLWSKLKKYGL